MLGLPQSLWLQFVLLTGCASQLQSQDVSNSCHAPKCAKWRRPAKSEASMALLEDGSLPIQSEWTNEWIHETIETAAPRWVTLSREGMASFTCWGYSMSCTQRPNCRLVQRRVIDKVPCSSPKITSMHRRTDGFKRFPRCSPFFDMMSTLLKSIFEFWIPQNMTMA